MQRDSTSNGSKSQQEIPDNLRFHQNIDGEAWFTDSSGYDAAPEDLERAVAAYEERLAYVQKLENDGEGLFDALTAMLTRGRDVAANQLKGMQ